jgi:uncharacterized phage protein (TIGR02218 family)
VALSAFTGTGIVATIADNRRLTVSGIESYADGWFTNGKLTFTSGANNGRSMEVKRHGVSSLGVSIELWQPMSETIAVADAFSIAAGSDKQFQTCKTKLDNAANFRGFPYMPGNDAIVSVASQSQALDGGSRYGN